MFLLRGHSLGDYIDQTDPCTANPSDPICIATASDTAQDPCVINPTASYCQASVVQQSGSLPTPGSNDSQWNQYVQGGGSGSASSAIAAVIAAVAGGAAGGQKPPTPTLNPTKPQASAAAASLLGVPNKWVLGALALLGAGLLIHRQREIRASKRAA